MRIRTIVVFSLLVAACVVSWGCADLHSAIEQTSAWRDRAVQTRDALDEQLASLRARRASAEPGSSQADRLDAEIALVEAQRAVLAAAADQADRVLAEARDPEDSLTRITRAFSEWLPAPAQGPLVLGAALLATMARSRQLRQSAESIIDSINHVLERDERFRALFESHADTIRTIQTPAARKLVDRTTRRRAQG